MSEYKSRYIKGAVALGYNSEEDGAPRVIAKGQGFLAEKIVEVARENRIMVEEDPLLFDSLYRLEVGDEIPAKLYQVVAEILAYVYKINRKKLQG
ncbi:MAG: EscU/YscU/HrcU family type III secretion system export apparatus switch protein [Bacteroidota bacterium]|jgi:flagellar biosynthesis protein|nr:flagellar biosynthesis protein FlhB [Ignavibacteria bacterium]HEX2962053.1 EscU/YscU/HrcU family type III secretion system export apparatus switch protein [Ignavibacteriales bacterium]MCU7499367.1 flagellar biosynthesis protein FlhB [Ignavibacteria bacterium]MCU7513483.1 flagellar biosynthesis protein FlhB [Ignavibacteria bacterium]MCU7518932.1 flagellar biosynthesis protein FlhB [Ignavibacteria bacterium]